jgi:hypothetical protein
MSFEIAPLYDGLALTPDGVINSKSWRIWFSRLHDEGGVIPALHASTHESGGSDTVNHDSLVGFVANEHVNHTAVSIIAGTGLSGGGDISADRTLSTDDSAIDHDSLLNWVANKHIDWTNASNDLLTSGDITTSGTGHMLSGAYVRAGTYVWADSYVNATTQYNLNGQLAHWSPEATSNGIGVGTLVNLNTAASRFCFALGSFSQNQAITNLNCVSVGPSSLLFQTASSFMTAVGGDVFKGSSGIANISYSTGLGYGVGMLSTADRSLYLGALVGETNSTDYRLMVDVTNNATPLLDGHFWDTSTTPWLIINGYLTIATADALALTIGKGTAGIDYQIKVDGETNDGILTWMEDEDYFDFADTVKTSASRISKITRITGNTTLDATHEMIAADTDGGAFNVTLPAGINGLKYPIKNVGSSGNNVTLIPDGAESIESTIIADGECFQLVYETTEGWFLI